MNQGKKKVYSFPGVQIVGYEVGDSFHIEMIRSMVPGSAEDGLRQLKRSYRFLVPRTIVASARGFWRKMFERGVATPYRLWKKSTMDENLRSNAGETLKLYVWPHAGGWARHWEVPQELSARAPWFFMFGRYGGGWSPFSSAKFGTREETQAAAEAAHQRFGLPVEIFYGQAPPASER